MSKMGSVLNIDDKDVLDTEHTVCDMYQKLTDIQNELKCPKSQYNSFGGFSYRRLDDILENLKPILKKYGAAMHLSDDIVHLGDRYYIKATCRFSFGDQFIETKSYARETSDRKGMDDPQLTGSSSTYARKYAVNAMFLLDDSIDPDSCNNSNAEKKDVNTSNNRPPANRPPSPDPNIGKKKNMITNLCDCGKTIYGTYKLCFDCNKKRNQKSEEIIS